MNPNYDDAKTSIKLNNGLFIKLFKGTSPQTGVMRFAYPFGQPDESDSEESKKTVASAKNCEEVIARLDEYMQICESGTYTLVISQKSTSPTKTLFSFDYDNKNKKSSEKGVFSVSGINEIMELREKIIKMEHAQELEKLKSKSTESGFEKYATLIAPAILGMLGINAGTQVTPIQPTAVSGTQEQSDETQRVINALNVIKEIKGENFMVNGLEKLANFIKNNPDSADNLFNMI